VVGTWSTSPAYFAIEVTQNGVQVFGRSKSVQDVIVSFMLEGYTLRSYKVPSRGECEITAKNRISGFDGIVLRASPA
jgi:hypothetical protein